MNYEKHFGTVFANLIEQLVAEEGRYATVMGHTVLMGTKKHAFLLQLKRQYDAFVEAEHQELHKHDHRTDSVSDLRRMYGGN